MEEMGRQGYATISKQDVNLANIKKVVINYNHHCFDIYLRLSKS